MILINLTKRERTQKIPTDQKSLIEFLGDSNKNEIYFRMNRNDFLVDILELNNLGYIYVQNETHLVVVTKLYLIKNPTENIWEPN